VSIKLRGFLLFLIFLNGYVSLSMELVVMRQLSFYVGSSAVVSSIIIGIFLGAMSLGYFRGSARKITRAGVRRTVAASFLVIAIMTICATSFSAITLYFQTMYSARIFSGVSQTFIYSLAFLSVAPFLFGLNTALLSRYLHRHNRDYTGNIMAWDTIGSVLGSLATTLILMPIMGVNWTIILIVALALLGMFIARPRAVTAVLAVAVLIPAVWINSDGWLRRRHGIIVNNANSTISVMDTHDFRALFMNNVAMSHYDKNAKNFAQYINYINYNFLYNMPHDRVREVLILGAGGFTAGLDDHFHNYTFIDIEPTLRKVSEKHFLPEPLGPNKKFVVADASQFLKNTDKKYDVILLDVYSNSYSVPEDFITLEFMQRLRARVADGGVILMNVICSPNFSDTFTRVFDNTFHRAFPHNTGRQIIGYSDAWGDNTMTNVVYIFYNHGDEERIYTINKTGAIYDR
jgi:predicted membrane-bound spermidine synthase